MILCYHDVDPEWRSPLAVTPDEFRRQCEWLAEHRTVVSLTDLIPFLDDRMLPPRGLVALTFDDGFRGVHEHALPVLEEHGWTATVFLVSSTLRRSSPRPVDWVDGEVPGARHALSRSQVEELSKAGIDLQSHGATHRVLTHLDVDECREDLAQSKKELEEALERPVDKLAYPKGRHNASVRRAAGEVGFRWAFTLPEASEHVDSLAVPRVGVFPGNGPTTLRMKTRPSYLAFRHSRVFPLARRLLRRG